MSHAATTHRDRWVRATLNYVIDTGVKPVAESYGSGPGGLMRRTTGVYDPHEMTIADGRAAREPFTLDASGFERVDWPTKMKSFFDGDELRAVFYPEVEALIRDRTGAVRVHVFDHTLRSSDEVERAARQIREPVMVVHNDYTEWSGPQRVRDFFRDDAEALTQRRFAIIQVWRGISGPILRDPLALIDARSFGAGDFVPTERRFPDRVGEIYQFKFNPAHRWVYFPELAMDEALVFKTYDSAKDGRARWSAHTAFADPAAPAGAPPRESIEIRAFAFF